MPHKDADIQQIIDTYQPPWLPQEQDLPPIVVAIDPIGGDSHDAAQRARDDLALMTGAHLYHMVRHAGAAAIMTRADDQPALPLTPFCDEHAATLAVSVVFEDDARTSVETHSEDTLSSSLTSRLTKSVSAPVNAKEPRASARTVLRTPGALVHVCASPTRCSPTHPREVAADIYRGIAAFVREHENALHVAPTGHRRCIPHLPSQTWEEQIASAARRIWPDDDLPPEKAAWFARVFRAAVLHDRSAVHFEPRVTVEGDTVIIGGATNIELLAGTLRDALHAVGIEHVTSEMRLLPQQGRLDTSPFGICTATSALTYDAPSPAAGMQSQILHGEPLWLLDRANDHYLAQAADGYCGWVRETAVRVVSQDEFDRRVSSAGDPGAAPTDGGVAQASRLCGAQTDAATHIVTAALRLLHRPYIFGGIAPIGLDCSGLVRHAFEQIGQTPARDAAQQFLAGRLVATRWHRDNIRAGDLLFFINTCGRIFHVAIAVSPTHYIHSAPPEVQINSLTPTDPLYNEHRDRAFFAAKRL